MLQWLGTLCNVLGVPAVIKQYVIDPVKVQISYICCSESILENLRDKVKGLKETTNNLQPRVNAARQKLETIRPEVEDWLRKAAEKQEETDNFLQNIPAEVQEGCINGICSNPKSYYSVSRKAMEMAKAIDALCDRKFDTVADPPLPPGMEIIPVPFGTEFESRKTKEEEIMAALRDDSVYLIGICGMGGVGKTTMAKNIRKRAMEKNLFDMAAMAVVGQQPNHSEIQQQIAEALALTLEQKEVEYRASKIRTRLMQEKSILVIIDDIWARLDLEKLGIPSQSIHKGCKIILTSRDSHVCTAMEATKFISLEGLGEMEAWALFKANANTCVDDCNLHQTAKAVAEECNGLPLALVTVGRALRDQMNPNVWKDALGELQKAAPLNIPGVLEDVYQPLAWSYNNLPSPDAKDLFLLCCLFPEDSPIILECLLHYGVGLRIFSNVETLRQARGRVDSLVDMLKSRNLLIDHSTRQGLRRVKMHDVIRDMAISIASSGEHVFMINHDAGLKDWPRKDSYENCTCISVTLNGDVTLPECINCPRLEMLRIVFYGDEGKNCPDKCFDTMRELNVLDVENITSLPSSLQFLTNLRTLRLRRSKMRTVSIIGQLVKLEILDLRSSNLEVLPKEIGELENLNCLDLSWCRHLREIAPGVISSLTRLEELFIYERFKNWEAEVEGKERGNASLVEVASLKNLTALKIEIPDPKVLPQDTLHWPMLERFAMWIGTSTWASYLTEYDDNILTVDLKETTPLVDALIRKAHSLVLKLGGMCANDEVISSIQGGNQDLKRLSLEGCGNINYLANIPNALQYLELKDLCKLTHLFDQKLCLPHLSEVCIQNCSSLQYVVLQSTAENLSQLKKLKIEECPVLEEVFKAERGESANVVNPIVFPNLTTLFLEELPNLISFCKAFNGIDCPLLKDLKIKSLHNLKVFWPMEESSSFEQGEHNSVGGQFLFHQKVTFASIRRLTLNSIDTATKIFSSQIPVDSFSQLETLMVFSCPNLKVIFSPPAFRNFRNLNWLTIGYCSNLEAVVGKEDEKAQPAAKEDLFPELMTLTLERLPDFKTFCHMKNDIEWPKLNSITIEDCPQMETFSPRSLSLPCGENVFELSDPNRKVTFANLVDLELRNIGPATMIFSSQIPNGSLSRLKQVKVESCPNLEVIFPPTFRNLGTLSHLTVKNCSKLKEVVKKEDEESQAEVREPLFLKLEELILSGQPNLKTFCHVMNDIDLSQLQKITIVDCPQLETFSLGSLSFLSSTQVSRSSDPDFTTQIFFKKEVFASLVELKLSNSNATKIFSSQIPVASFSQLRLLEVNSCPNLEVIFSPPSFRNFRNLKELRIHDCRNLEAMVGKEDEKAQTAAEEPLFPELKTLTLKGLPNFRKFCHMKNDIEWQKLESVTLDDCPQMEYAFGLLDPNVATQFFHNREVIFASLVELKLYNIKTATKLFSSQIPIGSFGQLDLLEVQSCPNLKIIFSPPAFRNFKSLHILTLKNCPNLEEVVAMEDEEQQTAVAGSLFPELEILVLSELPNIKMFCHMKNGVELPQLQRIYIEGCLEMETFSLGSLSLPSLTYVFGLLEPDLATRILFKKEIPEHEIPLENDSFTLSAKDLSISNGHGEDKWTWCLVKYSSDNFIVVARQWESCELKFSGRFEMLKLSPETLYEVVLEIMLDEYDFFCIKPVNIKLTQSEGITKERFEDLDLQPTGKWIEVFVGEFTTSPDPIGDLEFSFYSRGIKGLLVKGFTIRSKTIEY